jgi:hypothetical protein
MPYADPQKQREFQRDWKRRTKEWFWELKASLKCERCSFSHPAAMHFHHRGDDKAGEVGRMATQNFNREVILAEIAKCEVLCANCHAILHFERGYPGGRQVGAGPSKQISLDLEQ